jgi:hypothetical protein
VGILVADEVKTLMRKVDDLEEWLWLQGVVGASERGPSSQATVEKQLFLPEESENEEGDLPGDQEEKEGEDTEDDVEEVEPAPHPSIPAQPTPSKPAEKRLPKSAKLIVGREQVSSAFCR